MDVLLQAGKQLVLLSFVAPAINNSSPGTCAEGKNGTWQKNCDRDKDAMETSSKGCRSHGENKVPIYPDLPWRRPLPLPQIHRASKAGINSSAQPRRGGGGKQHRVVERK